MQNKFGPYQVLEEIGRGGMGIVYRALDETDQHIVALKVLVPGSLANGEHVQRFYREAQLCSELDHPNIIKVYRTGQEHGYHYFAMDFIDGTTMQKLMDQKTSLRTLLVIVVKIAKALHVAHQQKIVHRDIKPSNILVANNGEPYLTDFGLAKSLEANTMTQTGALLGTPFYMSPEQVRSQRVTPSSDIYSLGVVLYQCMTGQLPFVAESHAVLYCKILEEEPPLPRELNPRISGQLETICLKAMEKLPARRYPDALAMAHDIENYLKHRRSSQKDSSKILLLHLWKKYRKKFPWVMAGLCLLILMVAGALFLKMSYGGTSRQKQAEAMAQKLCFTGEQYFQQNSYEKALAAYQEALQKAPASANAHAGIARIALAQGELNDAEISIQKALSFSPNDPWPLRTTQMQIFIARDKCQEARNLLALFPEDIKQTVQMQRIQASLAEKSGDRRGASIFLHHARLLEDKEQKKSFEKVEELVREKQYAAALTALEGNQKKFGDSVSFYLWQGKIYAQQKDWQAALTALSKVIKSEPRAEHFYERALVFIEAGYYEEAKYDLERARERAGDDNTLQVQIEEATARLLLSQNEYFQAYERYQKLSETGTGSPQLYLGAGQAAYYVGEYSQATNYLTRVLESKLVTEDLRGTALLYRGMNYRLLKKYQQALTDLQEASKTAAPPERAEVETNLGTVYLELGNYSAAREWLEKAKESASSLPLVAESLGRYYFHTDKPEQALRMFDQCIQLIPWEARYYHEKGKTLYQLKMYQEAQRCFNQAMELNPSELAPLNDLMVCIFDEGSLEGSLYLGIIFFAYIIRFYCAAEVQDLFQARMEALNRQYREAAYPQLQQQTSSSKEYEHFLTLLEQDSEVVHQLAMQALSRCYLNEPMVASIGKQLEKMRQEANPRRAYIRRLESLLAQIRQQKWQAQKRQMKRLVVRMLVGKDLDALTELDRWGSEGETLLRDILQDAQEDIIVRFLTAQTLLQWGTYQGVRAVKNYLATAHTLEEKLFCAVALRQKGFYVPEPLLIQGLQADSSFLRALAVCHLSERSLGLLEPLIHDADERICVYAAARLWNQGLHREQAKDILTKGCASRNPLVRMYCYSELWPMRNPNTGDYDMPLEPHQKDLVPSLAKALQDSNPSMQGIAAVRIGMYRLHNLAPALIKLVDTDDSYVHYYAITSLGWLKNTKKFIHSIFFDTKRPLLDRFAATTGMFHDFTALQKLPELASEKDPRIGCFAIGFIGSFGGLVGSTMVGKYLKHPHPDIRRATANSITIAGSSTLLPQLNKLLDDPNPQVQKAVVAALVRITALRSPQNMPKLKERLQNRGQHVKSAAAFGYYFPIFNKGLNQLNVLSQGTISIKDVRAYQFFRDRDIVNFVTQAYLFKDFQQIIREPEIRARFLNCLHDALDMDQHPMYYYLRALLYEATGALDKAVTDIGQATMKAPESEKYLTTQAQLLLKAQRYPEAIQVCSRLLQMNPRSWDGWHLKGKACEAQQQFPEAMEAYRQTYILSPQSEKSYGDVGRCLAALGKYQEAQEILEEGENLHPDSRVIRVLVAVCHIRMGQTQQARSYWQRYQLKPPSPDELSQFPELAALK